jgi:hypothetical protein
VTEHTFEARLFPWNADRPDSWVFATLPEQLSDEIEETAEPRGFGSVRVQVRVGASEWSTSLFPSKTEGAYVLPVKKPVRRAEGLEAGETATFTIRVEP